MTYTYKTFGTCAQQIEIEIDEDETIKNVKFLGGCNGNLQGISKLVEGQKIDDV
ncbi:MAG: TSCPD domain-containing protein, partial [Eubacterium sp.]|nr:TSCPD domain-containing protein [Eubacterium sp.]